MYTAGVTFVRLVPHHPLRSSCEQMAVALTPPIHTYTHTQTYIPSIQVGKQVGGDWLAGWIVLAAAVSNVGLFLAEMSSDAYQIMGMAEIGLLPSRLGHKSSHGTPTYAIWISTCAILVLSLTSSFGEIIVMVNFLYAIAEIFEIAAFLILRLDRPDLPRPYKMPVNTLGAFLVMVLPLVFIAIVLLTATGKTWFISGGLAAVIVGSYFVMEYLKRHHLCEFYVSPSTPVSLSDFDQDDDDDDEGGDEEEELRGQDDEAEEEKMEDTQGRGSRDEYVNIGGGNRRYDHVLEVTM